MPFERLCVLIIDDGVIDKKIVSNRLSINSSDGVWTVHCAPTGEDAIAQIEEGLIAPDVIIIDQDMSKAGGKLLGHEVVEILRGFPNYESVVIIGCTANPDTASMHLTTAGCDAVWMKPMPSQTEAVKQIIELRRMQSPWRENAASAALLTAKVL